MNAKKVSVIFVRKNECEILDTFFFMYCIGRKIMLSGYCQRFEKVGETVRVYRREVDKEPLRLYDVSEVIEK